jgi:hypothetical protein
MSDTVSWTAVALSIASASIATVAAWTNREKLRLDLYDRRFSIYVRAADLRYQLMGTTYPASFDCGYAILVCRPHDRVVVHCRPAPSQNPPSPFERSNSNYCTGRSVARSP